MDHKYFAGEPEHCNFPAVAALLIRTAESPDIQTPAVYDLRLRLCRRYGLSGGTPTLMARATGSETPTERRTRWGIANILETARHGNEANFNKIIKTLEEVPPVTFYNGIGESQKSGKWFRAI